MNAPLTLRNHPSAEQLRRLPWRLALLRLGTVAVLATALALLLR